MKEVWKDIPGYEGLYKVSDKGQVFSMRQNKIMSLNKHRQGYLTLHLYNGKSRVGYRVHRLVMLGFKGYSDLIVNHIDGVKSNNKLSNLEYCTYSENMKHSYDIGLRVITKNFCFIKNNPNLGKIGKLNNFSKKVVQYSKEGNIIKHWDCMSDVTRELGILASHISEVCKEKRKTTGGFKWKYI